ncbi:caspase family protein [Embleya sp. NBC_00888]|uniref:VMAP-C domain-containing protein n=1 Tax=Embleya sp. NBC_00888 TaxID=2975960 RepID=UPI003867213C|nr:caspase family protein [Embleya sp. NBC_00888]
MSSRDVDPARTYAIVVAMERYRHLDLDLVGPYTDGCRFIHWLFDRGVPPENVEFVASPPAHDRPEPPVPCRAHPGEELADLFQDIIAKCDADLLWVFWGGHGVTDDQGASMLLLEDSQPHRLRGLPVANLVRTLLGTSNQGRRIARVAVVLDACQTQLRPGQGNLVPRPITGTVELDPDRGLFLLQACAPGQAAHNPQRSGLFSRRFLDRIEQVEPGLVLPDLNDIYDGLSRRFVADEDTRTFRYGQRPGRSEHNWDGRTTWDEDPARAPRAAEVRRALADIGNLIATSLPDENDRVRLADDLGRTLDTYVPEPDPDAIAIAAVQTRHGLSTLVSMLPSTLPAAVVRSLEHLCHTVRPGEYLTRVEHSTLIETLRSCGIADLEGVLRRDPVCGPGFPPGAFDAVDLVAVLEGRAPPERDRLAHLPAFVEAVAHHAPNLEAGARLRAWNADLAARHGTRPDLLTARRGDLEAMRSWTREEQVWIRLEIAALDAKAQRPADTRYRYTARVREGGDVTTVSVADDVYRPWTCVRSRVAAFLQTVLDRPGARPAVECFLEPGQLDLQIERIAVDRQDREQVPLGAGTPVVVRCRELRAFVPDAWLARWRESTRDEVGAHHWLCHEARADTGLGLRSALTKAPSLGCVHLVGEAAQVRHHVALCLLAGVPVALWHRRGAGCDLAHLREQIRPRDLPEAIRRWRADNDGQSVVLLWDDPTSAEAIRLLRGPSEGRGAEA